MAELFLSTLDFDDVHLNLALEEILLHAVSSGEIPPVVRVWRNPESVIMGISRSINADLNLENIQDDRIPIARRASGGGTVYHDSGTVSYSFIFPWNVLGFNEDPRRIGRETIIPFLDIIIRSLRYIGLEGRSTGVSDIFIGDKKISGNAQKRIRGAILHHGTCLLDVDIEKMTRYLKIPPERKGIPHEGFVTSLKKMGCEINFDGFRSLLVKSLEDTGHSVGKIKLDSKKYNLMDKARDLASTTYSRDEWIYRR